jgi:hypothetical protein
MARARHSRGEYEKLLRAAERAGLDVSGGGKRHYVVKGKDGRSTVYVSCSPSASGTKRVRSDLRKLGVDV